MSVERIENWLLEERIGTGGVADVWRAHHAEDGREVALKVLREPGRSLAHRDRFLREGRLLLRLGLPGLPRCYEVGDGVQPYLALELLEGETLGERLRSQGPLPVEEVERVTATLLTALSGLHVRGIIHRDVKSSNVFLVDDGRVLLLDLGLAADPQDPLMTTLGDVMGTYAYMAPEQIAGAEVDHRCDLYSLGITLYEALAGNRPFYAQDATGYLIQHREGKAPPLVERRPNAPARLVDTVTRLMARDPAARPHSAAIGLALLMGAGGIRRSLSPPPLVGRAAAVGAIRAAIDAGGCVTILGEIGSGLSRMAAWALETSREEHFETIALRCNSRAPPMDPVFQLARHLAQILSAPMDPTPDALGHALADLAGEGPLFLLIEDLDQASAEAVAALATIRAAASGVVVVTTGQRAISGFPSHMVQLRPLSTEEIGVLVAGMLGTRAVPAGMAEELHRISGGMPAVVVMGVRELASRGALRCEGVSDEGEPLWRLDRNVSFAPTVGLARMFGDVLLRLPDSAQALLEVLSVAGTALPLGVALSTARVDPSGEAVGPLVKEGLATLEVQRDGEWVALRRPAVGALVLAQTPEVRQVELHQSLGRHISRLPRDLWRDQRVAWHTAMGADPGEATSVLLTLSEQLVGRGLYHRALELLGRAAAHPPTDAAKAATLAVIRGEALGAVGRRLEAMTALKVGCELARDLGAVALEARALVAASELQQEQSEFGSARTLAERALSLLAGLSADPLLPRALLAAANACRIGAASDQAAEYYEQCSDVGAALGQYEYGFMALGGRGQLAAEDGRLEDAARQLEEEVVFLRSRTLPVRLITTLYRLSTVRLRIGDVRAALDALNEGEIVARNAELPFDLALMRLGRATVMLEVGDVDGAVDLVARAQPALERDADVFLRLTYRTVQGELRMRAGDHQAALAAFQAAEVEASRAGFISLGAYCLGIIGVLTADTQALTQGGQVLSRSGDRSLTARLLLYGARVAGDADLLGSAEESARASSDRFVLLEVLYAVGGEEARREAAVLVRVIDARMPWSLRPFFYGLPAVRWAGLGDEIAQVG